MELPQKAPNVTSATIPQQEALKAAYVDFVASGGLIEARDPETNEIKYTRLTQQEFADSIGVDRKTLYRWRQSIPDFYDRVNDRNIVWLNSKVPEIMQTLFVKAKKGDNNAIRLMLQQTRRLVPEKAENVNVNMEVSFTNHVPIQ